MHLRGIRNGIAGLNLSRIKSRGLPLPSFTELCPVCCGWTPLLLVLISFQTGHALYLDGVLRATVRPGVKRSTRNESDAALQVLALEGVQLTLIHPCCSSFNNPVQNHLYTYVLSHGALKWTPRVLLLIAICRSLVELRQTWPDLSPYVDVQVLRQFLKR